MGVEDTEEHYSHVGVAWAARREQAHDDVRVCQIRERLRKRAFFGKEKKSQAGCGTPKGQRYPRLWIGRKWVSPKVVMIQSLRRRNPFLRVDD